MIEDFIIVDSHTHTYPTDDKANTILNSFTSLYNMQPTHIGKGTIEEVVSNMNRDNIDYTILANFAPIKILHQNNLWTIEMSKKYPKLIPLISIHPEMECDIVDLLKKYIKLGAKGIKIHSSVQDFIPNDLRLKNLYEYCNEISFPILFHCGLTSEFRPNNYSDLEMLMPIIDNYGNIPIILGHMAEGNVNDLLWLSKNYQNIYFDTSIVISGLLCIKRVHDDCWHDDEVIIEVIDRIGASRILFGSDYPFGSPIHDIKRIMNINISHESKKLILGENTIRIFSIKDTYQIDSIL